MKEIQRRSIDKSKMNLVRFAHNWNDGRMGSGKMGELYIGETPPDRFENVVLKLDPKLAPVKIGVFPLVNKLKKDALKIYESLKEEFVCQFDTSGSVGRRYARADEIGIPYCVTVDFEKDWCVTVRDRDSTKQVRVKKEDLMCVLYRLLKKELKFEKAGKLVK